MVELSRTALVYLVLGAGILFTLLLGLIQVRGLPAALSGTRDTRQFRRGLLATTLGMGSLCGGALALEFGGPGAIGWMWVATILGMALTYAETFLALRTRDSGGSGPTTYLRHCAGKLGPALGSLYALVALAFALSAGSALQSQQSGAMLGGLFAVSSLKIQLAVALIAAPAVLMPKGKIRAVLVTLAPAMVAAYLLLLVTVIAQGSTALSDHLQTITDAMFSSTTGGAGIASGGLLVVLSWGVTRATLASGSGLGSAAISADPGTTSDDPLDHGTAHKLAASSMLAPLLAGGVITTLTALALMTHGVNAAQRIDDPQRTAQSDTPSDKDVPADYRALERAHSRGSKASMKWGQTLVMPVDTPLKAGMAYPMVFRANPRGHLFGKVSPLEDKNAVVISNFAIAKNIDTVVFRDAHKLRRHDASYDLRIAVTSELHALPNGGELLALTPADPKYDLKKLRTHRTGPYLVLEDFHFQGTIGAAFSPDNKIGQHLAMFENRAEDAPLNPQLRTILSLGFRGPYFDNDKPRPPVALLAQEQLDAEIGERITLQMQSPARGLAIGQLIEKDGVLRTPAWDFLADTTTAILRHNDDPSQDLHIPVSSKLVDSFLQFESTRPDILDFRHAREMKQFTGPYLSVPDYVFDVEVHSALRAPDPRNLEAEKRNQQRGPLANRKSLVPIHPFTEPKGGEGELFHPHPASVTRIGMRGPFRVRHGSAQIADLFQKSLGKARPLAGILVLFLAVTTMMGWSLRAEQLARHLFGPRAAIPTRVLFLVVAVAGGALTLDPLLKTVDGLMLPMALLNLMALLALYSRFKRPRSPTTST